jgi:hypothetical protein
MITDKVMKVHESDTWIVYRLACDDGDQDHDMTFEIEYDKKLNMIFFNFYKRLAWCAYWQTDNWFTCQWKKIKAVFRMLFLGYIEVEESMIINDPKHMKNFIDALKEGQKKLEKLSYKK